MKKPNHVLMYRILLVIEGRTLHSLQNLRALYSYDEIDLKRCVRFLEDRRMIRVDAIELTHHVTEAGHEFVAEAKQAGIWTPEIEKKPASTHVIEEKPAADQIKEIFESLTQEKIGKSEHELMCKILLVIDGRTLFSLRALPALYSYDEFDLKRCVRFLENRRMIRLDYTDKTYQVTETGYGFLEGAKQAGNLTQEIEKKPASTLVIEKRQVSAQLKEILEAWPQENESVAQYSPQFSQGKIGKSDHELMCQILLVIEGRTLRNLQTLPALYNYDEFDLKRCVHFLKKQRLINIDFTELTHRMTKKGYEFLEEAKQAGILTQEMASAAQHTLEKDSENQPEETEAQRRIREEDVATKVVVGFFGGFIGTFFRILFLRLFFGMFS